MLCIVQAGQVCDHEVLISDDRPRVEWSRSGRNGVLPKATKVIVRTRVDVIDKYGKASVDDTMFIMVTKATAAKFSYDGLASRILGDEIQMFCPGMTVSFPTTSLATFPPKHKPLGSPAEHD